MAGLKNVSECKIITPTGVLKFYLPFEERAALSSKIENIVSSGSATCLRYKCVNGIVHIIPKQLLVKSIITFSKSHNKTFA